MKLDNRAVAALKLPAGKRDAIHFDSTLRGFGYRLRNSGGDVRKSWVVQYRRAGATRRLLIGSAEVLSADQARAAAKSVLAKIALGQDPQADKAQRRAADKNTVRAMAEEFLAAKGDNPKIRPNTLKENCRYLRGPYFKPLHTMPIDQVTLQDVAARLRTIIRERGPTTAARARGTLSEAYAWAMGEGLAKSNPVIGTNRPETPPPRDRVLSDAELAAIWKGVSDDDFGRIVKLLALLGARRTEVGGMQWKEINFEKATWTIPSERAKNNRQHVLPLMPLVLDIIKGTPRIIGRDYLFGPRAAGFTSWNRPKQMLDAKLGTQAAAWTLHDLRRTCATRMADLGIQPHIIEQVLNHQSGHKGGIAGVYNRSAYEREVKQALTLWTDHINSLVRGRTPSSKIAGIH